MTGEKKKRQRRSKQITNCPHTSLKHYAKGMCNLCYHLYGRNHNATKCEHTYLQNYAKGLCQNCYFNCYNKNKRQKTEAPPASEAPSSAKPEPEKVAKESKKSRKKTVRAADIKN